MLRCMQDMSRSMLILGEFYSTCSMTCTFSSCIGHWLSKVLLGFQECMHASCRRLEHSLGVGHLAYTLADSIYKMQREELDISRSDVKCAEIAGAGLSYTKFQSCMQKCVANEEAGRTPPVAWHRSCTDCKTKGHVMNTCMAFRAAMPAHDSTSLCGRFGARSGSWAIQPCV